MRNTGVRIIEMEALFGSESNMNKPKHECRKTVTAIIGGVILLVQVASASVVGFDVQSSVYNGPGVLDATSRLWESGSSFLLDGQTITVAYENQANGSANAPIDLFDNYLHNAGRRTVYVTLTGLDLSESYDLVIYGAQNFRGGRGGLYRIEEGDGGANQSLSTTGYQQTTFSEGVNYVRFTGLVPDNTFADQRIRFSVSNGSEGVGILNGFEIESAPEPGVLTLLSVGGLAFLFVHRRRR